MAIASRLLFARRPRSSWASSTESENINDDAFGLHNRYRTAKDREISRQPNYRHRSTTHSEHESLSLSCVSVSESGINGNSNAEACRFRFAGNDQLPASVAQARARLLQRLGCVRPPVSRSSSDVLSRQNGTAVNTTVVVSATSNDFNVRNNEEHESLGNWLGDGIQSSEPDERMRKCKPPEISSKAFSSLQQEVFRGETEANSSATTVVIDCCICLDRFQQGDGLIKLHCGHKFHPLCLEPWMRIRADCPYCRAKFIS